MLSDQIESATDKITDMEKLLDDKKEVLRKTEELLQVSIRSPPSSHKKPALTWLSLFAARDPDQVVSGDAETRIDVPGDQPEAETGLSGSGERRFEEKTGQNPRPFLCGHSGTGRGHFRPAGRPTEWRPG